MYTLPARRLEPEYLPVCRRMGIFTTIYNPLAGGLLTGKQPNTAPVAGSRFDDNQSCPDRYWHPSCFAAVEELTREAHAHGRSLVNLALNRIRYHSAADCMILGVSRVEQLQANLAALGDGPLPEQITRTCDRVWLELRGVTPQYNR